MQGNSCICGNQCYTNVAGSVKHKYVVAVKLWHYDVVRGSLPDKFINFFFLFCKICCFQLKTNLIELIVPQILKSAEVSLEPPTIAPMFWSWCPFKAFPSVIFLTKGIIPVKLHCPIFHRQTKNCFEISLNGTNFDRWCLLNKQTTKRKILLLMSCTMCEILFYRMQHFL